MHLRIRIFAFLLISCLYFPGSAWAAPDSSAGFKNDYPRGTPRIKAATGLAPIQFVIDRIGGEYVDSVALIPAGFDPHTFEPKPSQLQVLDQADVYFSLETPLEQVWLDRVTTVNARMSRINLMGALRDDEILSGEGHSHSHDHEAGHVHSDDEEHEEPLGNEHSEVDSEANPVYDGHDPHIWMSPYFLKLIAKQICIEFSRLMPQQSAYFEKNLDRFTGRADQLSIRVRDNLEGLSEQQKSFLVFHPSWAYFAQEFGLVQIAVEQDGKEPTPASLAMVIDEARAHGISVIFVQREFNPALASTVAAHLPGGRVVALDPLGYDCFKSIEETAVAISGKPLAEPVAEE